MDLIEIYIDEVIQHCPKDTRENMKTDLRAKIDRMLPENPSEKEIRSALEKLGNPIIFADKFRGVKRYLIGPDLFYHYINTLRIVLTIAGILSAAGGIADALFRTPVDVNSSVSVIIAKLFVKTLSGIFQGIITSFFLVTSAFIIMEKKEMDSKNLHFLGKKWTIDDLPKGDSKKNKITRTDAIANTLLTLLFTSIICFKPEIIGLYIKKKDLSFSTPLFNLERLHSYIIIFLFLALFQIAINIYKFIIRKWSITLAVVNTVYNIIACLMIGFMVMDDFLYNKAFFSNFAQVTNISHGLVLSSWKLGLQLFACLFIVISMLTSVDGFVKSKKS